MIEVLCFWKSRLKYVAVASWLTGCGTLTGSSITDLRVESQTGWMVTDDPEPMLSWKTDGKGISGYEILAARTRSEAAAGNGTLWNSGVIPVSNGLRRRFDAKDLPARSEIWWQVRTVLEGGGHGDWSSPANFETGLKAQDWKAEWIGMAAGARGRSAPWFRKSFVVEKPIVKARLYVCGLGWHESWLNGAKLGDEVLQPAQTDYNQRSFYVSHDVTARIKQGDNVLGFWVGDGFFNQDRVWGPKGLSYGEPRVKGQLEVSYADGSVLLITTDKSWLCKKSPVTQSNLYAGEDYDARSEDLEWAGLAVKGEGWIPVVESQDPGGVLVAQELPPCRRLGVEKARSVREQKPGVWIYDFGVNLVGWAKFNVEATPGTKLTVRFAEDELSDGTLNFASGGVEHTKVIQTDTYICRGGGKESWEPRFTYHGFRFAELKISDGSLLTGNPTADLLEGVIIHTDLPVVGRFECSDSTLNTAFEWANRTFLGSIQGTPTDCPIRERCGWTGDAHLIVPFSMYRYDASTLWSKYTGDIVSSAARSEPMLSFGKDMGERKVMPKAAGIPTMVAPGKRFIGEASPDWGSALVFIPWSVYQLSGDSRLLERNYEGMRQWTLHLESRATDGIVKSGLGDWCKPDPGGKSASGSRFYSEVVPMLSTACCFRCASIMSESARLLSRREDLERFSKLTESIRAAFIREFYGPAATMTPDQTIHAVAVDWGILPAEMRSAAAGSLAELVENADYHFLTGVFGSPALWPVLITQGHQATAWKALQAESSPSLKHLAAQGATTFWEVWPGPENPKDPAKPYKNSMSHPFQGGFVSWFFSGLGGIAPAPSKPGFQSFLLEPQMIDGLNWVKCGFDSPMGEIKSEWKREGDSLHWEITIPPGSKASVRVPGCISGITPGQTAVPVGADDAQSRAQRLTLEAGSYRIISNLR